MSANGANGPEQEHPVPDVPAPGGRSPRTSALARFADRRPFRRKLDVLLGVPLVVIALLLGYVIYGLVGQARNAGSAAQLVRSSRQVATLVDRVESEHQQALLLSVRYESATNGSRPSLTAYRGAQSAVDRQVTAVRKAFGSRLPSAESQVLKEIAGLSSLRSTVEQSYLPADNIDPAYTSVIDDLIDGLGLDTDTNLSTSRTGNLLDSLLRAEASHSSFETSVFSAQTGDANALIEFVSAVGAEQVYTTEAARFGRYATARQASELGAIEQGTAWNTISQQYAGLQVDPSTLVANGPGAIKAAFTSALKAYPQYQQQAESRLRVTNSLIGQIADRADSASSNAWYRAAWLLAAALVAFALWLALSVAIRRSVIRPVQALTGVAAEVAEVAGRELARVADDDASDDSPALLREMPATARDEIGDLAAAFNRVQTTAAALLERQVLSRRNTAEMFGNVGRRVSNLTARQLSLIDAIERGETDPALLERLYRIDHLAVRLQRNADSLMLLADIRESGSETEPTPLTNVVRASLGQIEGYERVVLHAETEVTVAPDIIADLTLMLAELLENAVAFSPARSPVEVVVGARADGAVVEIADHGLGMSADRLAEENARLVRRERLDLVPTKVLGLFVVGSLARRWGVRVVLTRTQGGGVTAQVAIPAAQLLSASPYAESQQPSGAQASAGAGIGADGRAAGRAGFEHPNGAGREPRGGRSYEVAPYDNSPREVRPYREEPQPSGTYDSAPYGNGAYGGGAYASGAYGNGRPQGEAYQAGPAYGDLPYGGRAAELERGDLAERSERAARTPRHASRMPQLTDGREHPAPPAESRRGSGRHAAPPREDDFRGDAPREQAPREEPFRGEQPHRPEQHRPEPRPSAPREEAPREGGPAPLPRRVPQRTAAISSAAVPSARVQPGGGPVLGYGMGVDGVMGAPKLPRRSGAGAGAAPGAVPGAGAGSGSGANRPGAPAGFAGPQGGAGAPTGRPAQPQSQPRPQQPQPRPSAAPLPPMAATGPHSPRPPASPMSPTFPTAPSAPSSPSSGPSGPSGSSPVDRGAPRPLRRRVKGATLHATLGAAAGAGPAPSPTAHRPAADAEQVRFELDEFEAAVERANRDSAAADTGHSRHTTPTTEFPEGAEE
ncbi:ATP-binding protein [Streptomyces sp. CA2R106]|uniref:ATP-binding protein n=1 Tax=Streptomyces sp. CA2R106 TaxID=3120153 RepID=UPI003009C836